MGGNELQKAVFERLNGDGTVLAIAGAGKVFDGRPIRKALPHVMIGAWRIADFSTATEAGAEHRFEIEVWSGENGRREAADLAEAVRAALDDAALTVAGFVLVNLRHLRTRTERETRSKLTRARLDFRAVLEPAG